VPLSLLHHHEALVRTLENIDPHRRGAAFDLIDPVAIAEEQPGNGADRAVAYFRVCAGALNNIRNVCHDRTM